MTLSASLLVGMLVLTGAVAALVQAAAVVERGGTRVSAGLYAAGWGLLAFIPLAWGIFGGQTAWYVQAVGAYDFAGAIPFHVGGGIGAVAITFLVPRTRVHDARRSLRGAQASLGLAAFAALWIGWLVLMEFDLNHFVVIILTNSTVLAATSMVAALGVERLRTGKNTVVGAATGLVAGLAAATGVSVFLEPFAAVVTGLSTGVVAGAIAYRRRAGIPSLAGFVALTGLAGGVTGLLIIGLFEPTRGFLYTGSFALLIAQSTAVIVCVVYSALVCIPLGLIVGGRLRGRQSQWAIPDSNR